MQALDIFPHDTYAREGVYSSIPYLTSHSTHGDTSLIWMTAAESFVDIYADSLKRGEDGRLVDFASETGRMEFFLFGSASKDSPKKVAKTYAQITGFQYLPPLFSIGYHHSKWESRTSA